MHRAIAAASAVCLLSTVAGALGCFRIGVTTGTEIPAGRVAGIVPGVTTKQEILDWFGAPAEATDGEIYSQMLDVGDIAAEDLAALPFSDMLVYEVTDGEGRILLTILFNYATVKLKRDRLVVFFDENDVVLYYGVTRQRDSDSSADSEERADPDAQAESG